MNDDQLDDLLASLPKERQPARDLWPDIEARLESPATGRASSSGWPGVFALAAAACVLGYVGIQTPSPLESDELGPKIADATLPHDASSASESGSAGSESAGVLNRALAPWLDDYEQAVDTLAGAFASRKPNLEPGLVSVFDETIGVIDGAIQRSRLALVDEPDNTHLYALLDDAYQEKIAVLEQASTLPE